MFFMLARNRTSNSSPTTGTEPIAVSRKTFPSIRAINQVEGGVPHGALGAAKLKQSMGGYEQSAQCALADAGVSDEERR